MQWNRTEIRPFINANRNSGGKRHSHPAAWLRPCLFVEKLPIHQNLSTSFVDLAALVKHLRRLQFVGSIRVELSSCDADIIFTGRGRLHALLNDHVTGSVTEGEPALRRILFRAKEPNGRIHVFNASGRETHADVFIDEKIVITARKMAANRT